MLRRPGLVLAWAMLTLACGAGEERPDGAARDAGPAHESESALSQAAPGDVAYRDGRVSLRVEGDSNLAVLGRLADLAGFSVVADDVEPRSVSLQLEDAVLGEAVPALLSGELFSLDYVWDAEAGAQRLDRVIVGRSVIGWASRLDSLGMSDRQKTIGEASARMAARQPLEEANVRAASTDQLASADPAVRAAAVEDFESDDDEFGPLFDLLASDPDPGVRIAVLERLAGESVFAVTRALVGALDDPDPVVIVAALDALRTTGDASIVRDLDPLLGHADAGVQAAAAETIEYLR